MAVYLIALISVALVVGTIFLLRDRYARPSVRRGAHDKSVTMSQSGTLASLKKNKFFWGVEFSKPGCPESRELLGRQFPFDQAPTLPLPGCKQTIETCTCEFKGLRDRRISHRRLNPDRRTEVRFDKTHPDRRTNAGRRRGDRWVHHAL